MLFTISDDELRMVLCKVGNDVKSAFCVSSKLKSFDNEEFWKEACRYRWNVDTERPANYKAIYFVRNSLEIRSNHVQGHKDLIQNLVPLIRKDLSSRVGIDETTCLMSSLETGSVYNIDARSHSAESRVLRCRIDCKYSVLAVFSRFGDLVTLHFRGESLNNNTGNESNDGSKWILDAHIVSSDVVKGMYDYTLYSESEFKELLPGITTSGSAVVSFLCNYKPQRDFEKWKSYFEDGEAIYPMASAAPDGCKFIELIFSTVNITATDGGSWISKSNHPPPTMEDLNELMQALDLVNIRVDDLLLFLLLLFSNKTGFSASDWESSDSRKALHLWDDKARLTWSSDIPVSK